MRGLRNSLCEPLRVLCVLCGKTITRTAKFAKEPQSYAKEYFSAADCFMTSYTIQTSPANRKNQAPVQPSLTIAGACFPAPRFALTNALHGSRPLPPHRIVRPAAQRLSSVWYRSARKTPDPADLPPDTSDNNELRKTFVRLWSSVFGLWSFVFDSITMLAHATSEAKDQKPKP